MNSLENILCALAYIVDDFNLSMIKLLMTQNFYVN